MNDVSRTKRKAMTPARRLRIFEAHRGICGLCLNKIDGVREPWIIEHLVCLGLSGKDEDANCAPAHEACRRDKDKLDVAAIAKAKRNKQRHLGIKAPKQTIQSQGFPKRQREPKTLTKIVPRGTGLYQERSE